MPMRPARTCNASPCKARPGVSVCMKRWITPRRAYRAASACAVVRSFMAHHQGMSLLALTSRLLDQPMQRRFEADPGAADRPCCCCRNGCRNPPRRTCKPHSRPYHGDVGQARKPGFGCSPIPGRKRPAVQLLSNGRYHVMLTSGGGGYSRRNDMAVTRWQEDTITGQLGHVLLPARCRSGNTVWSAAHQPTLHQPESHEAIFSDSRAEFRARKLDFDTHRRSSSRPKTTSNCAGCTSPTAAASAQDSGDHHLRRSGAGTGQSAMPCTRRSASCSCRPNCCRRFRPSSAAAGPVPAMKPTPWMCHLLAAHGVDIDAISYETDRARFIGRGRNLVSPAALDADCQRLSGSAGPVLDPVVAIRCRITLQPGQTATIDLVTGVADSRDDCLYLINKYRDRHLADRVFDLAWTHSQVLLRQLNASLADARLFEQMASSLLYANASMRAENSGVDCQSTQSVGPLGPGDLRRPAHRLAANPSLDNIDLVQQMIQGPRLLAAKRAGGRSVDLERRPGGLSPATAGRDHGPDHLRQ